MYLQSRELCKFQRRLHDSRIRFLFCHDKWWLFCYCLIKAKFISPWANDFATIISTIETWSYLSTACACLPACLRTFLLNTLSDTGCLEENCTGTLWSYSFIIIRLTEIFIYFLNWINDLVNTLKIMKVRRYTTYLNSKWYYTTVYCTAYFMYDLYTLKIRAFFN